MPDHRTIIGSRKACELLYIDKSTLSRWAKNGTITPIGKLEGTNGALLFDKRDVEAMIEKRSA